MRLSAKPRLRRDAFFMRTDDGVWCKTPRGSLTVRGKHAFDLINRIRPALNGEYSLTDIISHMPDETREVVRRILDLLLEHQFLRDASLDDPHHLPPDIQERFGIVIEFLDDNFGSGCAKFELFRQSSFCLICDDSYLDYLVSSLADQGCAKLTHISLDGGGTCQTAGDAATTYALDHRSLSSPDHLASEIASHDYVIAVFNGYSKKRLDSIERACREVDVTLFPIVVGDSNAVVGPFIEPSCPFSVSSVLGRRNVSKIPMNSVSAVAPVCSSMILYAACTELLIHATAQPHSQLRSQFYHLQYENLTGSLRTTAINPLLQLEKGVYFPESPDNKDNSASYEGYADSFFGFIHELGAPSFCTVTGLTTCRVRSAVPTQGGYLSAQPKQVLSMTAETAIEGAIMLGAESYSHDLISAASSYKHFPLQANPIQGDSCSVELSLREVLPELIISAGRSPKEARVQGICRLLARHFRGKPNAMPAWKEIGDVEWSASGEMGHLREALCHAAPSCELRYHKCGLAHGVALVDAECRKSSILGVGFATSRTAAEHWAIVEVMCRHLDNPTAPWLATARGADLDLPQFIENASSLLPDHAILEIDVAFDGALRSLHDIHVLGHLLWPR